MGTAGSGSSTIIRVETAADAEAVDRVVGDAFGHRAEVVLVRRIRDSDRHVPELSLVAERDGTVVGHTMLSYVDLDDGAGRHRVLSLAPLAVSPAVQRQGIGSRLVREAIERADGLGEPLIVLEGSPAYYPRFGFAPAGDHGIAIDLPEWAPEEAAMVRRLAADDPTIQGRVVYPPAFDLDGLH